MLTINQLLILPSFARMNKVNITRSHMRKEVPFYEEISSSNCRKTKCREINDI